MQFSVQGQNNNFQKKENIPGPIRKNPKFSRSVVPPLRCLGLKVHVIWTSLRPPNMRISEKPTLCLQNQWRILGFIEGRRMEMGEEFEGFYSGLNREQNPTIKSRKREVMGGRFFCSIPRKFFKNK